MKEIILIIMASIFSAIYNIMVLVAYASHEKVEFKNICWALIIVNTFKDTILFGTVLSNEFLR